MNPLIAPALVSEGQRSNFATVLGDAVRKAAGTVVEELSKRGILNAENFQKVVERGDIIAATALDAVRAKIAELAEYVKGHLKLLSGGEKLTIRACKGKRTIAKSPKIFTWGIDGDFVNWSLDVPSGKTAETDVEVHEMVKDGTFKEIYDGVGQDLEKLCLTQDQIVAFVETHKKWLRTDGYGTLFLTKRGDDLFVVYVSVDSVLGLNADVYEFAYDSVWDAEDRHRFVLPKLKAA